MKRMVLISLGPLVMLAAMLLAWKAVGCSGPVQRPRVIVNDTVIPVEIADDEAEQVQGLSDRESLPPDQGLLFVFGNRQERVFWMKDMRFAIDILWIDKDKVVAISRDLPPEGAEPTRRYRSLYPVDKVLEVNAGFTDREGIRIGDRVEVEY